MLTNMFYQVHDRTTVDVSSTRVFLVDQVDLIGGIDFIFYEVCESFIHLHVICLSTVDHCLNSCNKFIYI